MGISLSVLLIALGAILTWALSADVSGIDLQVAGVILMVVGAVGLIASLIFWSSWGGFGNRDGSRGRWSKHHHRGARARLGSSRLAPLKRLPLGSRFYLRDHAPAMPS